MKKIYLMLVVAILFSATSFAQLTGVKTIPGNYATIALAIADLNTQGVGAGGVTFNIAAGYTETITATLALTATGTAANPIIFQKNGAGANPIVTAYTGGTATPATTTAPLDGIFRLVGSDYVTIDGIDVSENGANSGNAFMEYGYAFFKTSVTDGCQNNIIKNCTVTLSRNNVTTGGPESADGSTGIWVSNTLVTGNAAVILTANSGANSNNKFYTNTIQNCQNGFFLRGFAATTPTTNLALYDQNNDVGGSSAATGNIIKNYGGGTLAAVTSYGIRAIYQAGYNYSYNVMNNNDGAGVNHLVTVRGIFQSTATSQNGNINNNTVTLNGGGTSSGITGIENAGGSTAAGNTININNNSVINSTYSTATTGAFTGIVNTATAATVNMTGNTVNNNSIPGTGTMTCMDGGSPTTLNMNNNIVTNNSKTGASGTLYSTRAGTALVTYTGNQVNTNSFTVTSGTSSSSIYGYYNFGSPTSEIYNNNTIFGLSISGFNTSTSSLVYGIYTNTSSTSNKTYSGNTINDLTFSNSSTGTCTVVGINHLLGTTVSIFKNKIYNLSASNGSVYGIQVGSGTTVNVYNNLIGNLNTSSAPGEAIRGISLISSTTPSTLNISYNTIYLNATSSGANFATSGIFHTYNSGATTATLVLRNNIIANLSTPTGTGLTVALRRNLATDLNNYSTSSNNNLFYAGTASASRLLYNDGTNSESTLAGLKTRLAPRESNSISENPPFASTTGSAATFLHIISGSTTGIESGASNISGITDDFDNDIRQGNPGYAGTGSAPDIGADEFAGTPIGVACTAPADQATTLILSGATASTITGNFTAAASTPTGYLVIRSSGAFTGTPTNGTSYSAGNIIGNGTVVQSGNTTTFTATGLTGNTSYTFTIISYNSAGCIGGPIYNNTNPLTGSAITCPSTPATPTTTNVTTNAFQLNFTSSRGGGASAVTYNLEVTTDAAFTAGIIGSPFTVTDTTTTQTTMSYTVSGLTASTIYYYRIKANGCNTSTVTGSVTTGCNPVSVPYNEGFESITTANTLPACMAASPLVSSGGKTQTYIAAGSNSALIARTGTKFGAVFYSPSNTSGYFFTAPLQLTGGVSYTASVYYKTDGIAWTDATIYYGTSPTTAAMTNTIASVSSAAATTYTQISGAFTPATTGVYYVGIRGFNATSSPNYIAFDDISVDLSPSCGTPTGLTATSITASSASIGFTCASCTGTYIVEYGAPGFTPGIGATAGTGGTVVTGPASPIVISTLTAGTSYDVYVRQNCGSSFSSNATKITFTTLCNAINVPYTENFDGATTPNLPVCTSREDLNNDGNTWTTIVAPTGYSGKTLRYNYSVPNAANDWFYTQGVNLTAGTSYTITYKYGNNSTTFIESMEVKYGTGATSASMTTTLATHAAINDNTPHTNSVVFTPAASGVYYFGFHAYSVADQFYLYLDDISITTTPLCIVPTGLAASSITTTSASISFTSPGTAILEYGLAGFTPGTGATAGTGGTVINPSTSPQSITSLIQNTTYDVYVRQDCNGGGNGYSLNSTKLSFSTLAPIPANDECSGAITLTQNSYNSTCSSATFTTNGATTSSNTSSCFSSSQDDDVWFSFVATDTKAVLKISNYASASGTAGSLYYSISTGTCAALTEFDCELSSVVTTTNGGGEIPIRKPLVIGQTYYVRILTSGSGGTANFKLCIVKPDVTPGVTPNACNSATSVTINAAGLNNNTWVPFYTSDGKLVAEINANGNTLGSVTGSVYVKTGTVRQGSAGYYMNRNITLTPATQPTTNVSVRLYFLNSELSSLIAQSGSGVTSLNDINVTKNSDVCLPAAAASGILYVPTSRSTYGTNADFVEISIPAFSSFYFNAGLTPLPVTFITFNAKRNAALNNITWSTSQEINSSLFVVERSTDGRNFTQIGQVAGAGNSTTLRTYQFNDISPVKGINYYRLRIVDRDNIAKFSDIRSVRNAGNADFTIYPNPVRDVMKVEINADKADKGAMIITDINGKQVYNRLVNIAAGNNTFSIDISNMAQGAYIIKIQLSEDMIVKKITKM